MYNFMATVLLLVVSIFNFVLAIIVVYIAFALMAIGTSFWAATNTFFQITDSPFWGNVWALLPYYSGIIIVQRLFILSSLPRESYLLRTHKLHKLKIALPSGLVIAGLVSIPRIRLKWIFLGFLLGIIEGVTCNLILPALRVYNAVAYGPSFTIFMLLTFAYTITRHRFLGLRYLFNRTIFFNSFSFCLWSLLFDFEYPHKNVG